MLDDFQSLAGWSENGEVSHGGGTVTVESVSEDPQFELSGFPSYREVGAEAEFTVEVTVRDEGTQPREGTVVYEFDGSVAQTETVRLDSGNSTTIEVGTTAPRVAKNFTHSVTVGDSTQSGTLRTVDIPDLGLDNDATESGTAGDDVEVIDATSSELARSTTLPADADHVEFHALVDGEIHHPNGTAELVVEGPYSDQHAVDLEGQSDATSGPTTLDVSQFAGQSVTVRAQTDGGAELELDYVGFVVDSTDDGIPDEVTEMDLHMRGGPDGVRGTPLDIDPEVEDTSGDGLADAEQVNLWWDYVEVAPGEWMLGAEVLGADAHPAMDDTTGDGLTDRQQLDGWEIEVVDSHEDAVELMKVVTDSDDEREVGQFFNTTTATAKPLLEDTTGNGLTDVEEFELGTDPSQVDTTGDGIPDERALWLDEEDPTVFTTTGPSARLVQYNQYSDWNPLDGVWTFEYVYDVEDEVGVAEHELQREGLTINEEVHPDEPRAVATGTTHNSTVEGILTAWRGSSSTVVATDAHGNTEVQRVHSQPAFYGEVLADFSPGDAGAMSGFTHGAAETPEMIVLIAEDPHGVYQALMEFLAEVDAELLAEMIAAIPDQIREQQELDNPFDPDEQPENHENYANGWYIGYGIYFVGSLATGLGAITKGVSEVGELAQRFSQAANNLDTVRPSVRAMADGGTGQKTVRMNHRLMTDGGHDELVAPFQTAGKNAKGVNRLQQVDSRIINHLDGAERTELLRHLSNSENGVRLVDDLGPERTQALLTLSVRQTDNTQLRQNLFQLHDKGISPTEIDDFVRHVEELQRTDTTGIDRTVEHLSSSPNLNAFRGASGELDYATFLQRQGNEVLELQEPTTNVPRPGDIDIKYRDQNGQVVGVEVKNRQFERWDGFKDDMGKINAGYETMRSEGELNRHKMVFTENPPREYREWLDSKDIPYEVS